jgi:hypothetical protein
VSVHRDDSNAVTVDPDEVRRAFAAYDERVAQLEGRVATLEKRAAETGRDDDGWERLKSYAERRGISVRTVDRDWEKGKVEKKREDGTNRVYVRELLSSPSTAGPKRRRRRSPPIAGGDAPMSAAPGAPVWPFDPR